MRFLAKAFLAAFLLLPRLAWATTYYVDPGCPVAGNGTSAVCLSSPTTNNPKNTLANGVALLSSTAGDILELRGIHTAHDNCPGNTRGVYQADKQAINGKHGASGNPIIIQAYKYGIAGEERPFLEGVGDVTWTQCSTCDGGDNVACQGLTGLPSACTEYWYWYGTGNQILALSCAKADGTPCFWIAKANKGTAMTNATSGFVSTTCSVSGWMTCTAASDCPSGETCTGSTYEVDSSSDETSGGWIVARWGAHARGPVLFTSNGSPFSVCDTTYLTIRGIHFRDFRRAGISVSDSAGGCAGGPVGNITLTDNTFYYSIDTGGSDYQISSYHASSATISNSTFAYSGSESIHSEPVLTANGASAYTITGNFFHDNGDRNVLGPRGGASPNCVILSYTYTSASTSTGSNCTGSVMSNNLCVRPRAYGIAIEGSYGWTIRDNVIVDARRYGILVSPGAETNITVDGNTIFNNLITGCCLVSSDGGAITLDGGGVSVTNTTIYNNTVSGSATGSPNLRSTQGTVTNTLARNNIFSPGTVKAVNWTNTDSTNKLEYNLITTTANPAITWLNTNYACASLSSAGTGNIDNCPSAAFVSGSNFHIQSSSPAKDAGTSTGMPSGHTTDINKSLYYDPSGPTDYADGNGIQNGTWDIGVDEFVPPPVVGCPKKCYGGTCLDPCGPMPIVPVTSPFAPPRPFLASSGVLVE